LARSCDERSSSKEVLRAGAFGYDGACAL